MGSFITYEDYPGGNALKHYCGFIMRISRGSKDDDPYIEVNHPIEKTKDGKPKKVKEIIGNRLIVKADKTKISAYEGKEGCFDMFKSIPHIHEQADIVLNAELCGLLIKDAGYFEWNGDKFTTKTLIDALNDDKLFAKFKADYVKFTEVKEDDGKKASDKKP